MNNNYCVILAGGAGRKFWPFSRQDSPKQFLTISGSDKSYLRAAYERCKNLVPEENVIVVTTSHYASLVCEELPELCENNLLVEPYIRDTAPCIAFATYSLLSRDPLANALFLPCDNKVGNEEAFEEALAKCLKSSSEKDILITLGINPTGPDTNYGYIQAAIPVNDDDEPLKVKTFTEKPDAEIARVFIQSGEFYWNSGILAAKASVMKEELEKCLPLMSSQFEGWKDNISDKAFIEKVYGGIERTAMWKMMEKTERAWMIPGRFKWTDIGELQTYFDSLDKDADGNAARADTLLVKNCRSSMIMSNVPGKLIAVEGLEDYIVLDTDDILFICPRDKDRRKAFLSGISKQNFEKYR